MEEVGKAPDSVSLFRGHKGPVLDTAFDPFDSQIVASCSDDGNILIWKIPSDYSFHNYRDENEVIKDIVEPVKVLAGHSRKVGHIAFHPCAKDVLVSSSFDYSIKFWNVANGTEEFTLQHPDLVTSFAFNYNGQLLATTSRDKKIRIWDLPTKKVISEGPGHSGAKPSRVVWLGQNDRILTTGFSRLSDRQIGVWDVNDINKGPIDGFLVIDSSSGVLIPIFDDSNSLLYLAGKGDGNIRYYEYENDILFELSQYASTDAQRGFAATPKRYVNMRENEVLRSFKTINDHSIEPISFIVPRKSELFQEDLYADAPSNLPALQASEWFSGDVVTGPNLVNLREVYESGPNAVSPVSIAKPAVKETEVKPTLQESSPVKSEPITKITPAKSITPTPSVDSALKSSEKVDKLLERVEKEATEHERNATDDAEWSETRTISHLSQSKEQIIDSKVASSNNVEKAAEVKPAEVRTTTLPSTKAEVAQETGKVTTLAPTLRSTVDRLASLVSSLEQQISRLESFNEQKDIEIEGLKQRISKLEE